MIPTPARDVSTIAAMLRPLIERAWRAGLGAAPDDAYWGRPSAMDVDDEVDEAARAVLSLVEARVEEERGEVVEACAYLCDELHSRAMDASQEHDDEDDVDDAESLEAQDLCAASMASALSKTISDPKQVERARHRPPPPQGVNVKRTVKAWAVCIKGTASIPQYPTNRLLVFITKAGAVNHIGGQGYAVARPVTITFKVPEVKPARRGRGGRR